MHDVPPASLGLRRARLLEGLDASALERLARKCTWRRWEPGKTIVSRESRGHDVYIVIAGRVRATIYTASGRQVTFRDMGVGDLVGEVAAVDGGLRSADVVALTEVMTATIARADFRTLLREEESVRDRFMTHMARLVRLLSERVVEFSTLGVQNRIHADLLRLVRSAAAQGTYNKRLLSPAPLHNEIASRVSTTREQVTRELSALAKHGLLVKSAQGLLVTDIEVLARMVEAAGREA